MGEMFALARKISLVPSKGIRIPNPVGVSIVPSLIKYFKNFSSQTKDSMKVVTINRGVEKILDVGSQSNVALVLSVENICSSALSRMQSMIHSAKY